MLDPDAARPPMPIIVGAPRSGTTLLRMMLDSHPELAIPPETGFLALGRRFAGNGDSLRQAFFAALTQHPPEAPAWGDFGISRESFQDALSRIEPFSPSEGFRAFYRLYAASHAKPRYGDKTPLYCLHLDVIADVLPEARFVHLIRDGRDVALSVRETWFAPGRDIETLAGRWRECVEAARSNGRRVRHYLEVRYEELVEDTADVLARVCDFLALSFHPHMLRYPERVPGRLAEHRDRLRPDGSVVASHSTRLAQQRLAMQPPDRSRALAWRRAMSEDERARFESVAADALRAFGYPTAD